MIMKKLALSVALLGVALLQGTAAEVSWQTDMSKALTQAKAEKKIVLIDFTGSDW
jgi:hypothetical protein